MDINHNEASRYIVTNDSSMYKNMIDRGSVLNYLNSNHKYHAK